MQILSKNKNCNILKMRNEFLNRNNSEVLNRVFSKNTLKSFINGEQPLSYITSVTRYIKDSNGTNYKKISDIYEYLYKNHRNEYCYKNTLLNQLLVNSSIHNLKTTTALTEINVNKSKPDFVLINGKSVVYEIKTGLDNFERLEGQLNDYYKAFDNVIVITDICNVEGLIKILQNFKYAGISVLGDDKRILEIKPPEPVRDFLDIQTMFKILRKYEFENIVMQYYNFLPDVSQFKYYDACFELIKAINIDDFFALFKSELKKRAVIIEEDFLAVPDELKMLAYFSELKKKDYVKLDLFLNKPYLML